MIYDIQTYDKDLESFEDTIEADNLQGAVQAHMLKHYSRDYTPIEVYTREDGPDSTTMMFRETTPGKYELVAEDVETCQD